MATGSCTDTTAPSATSRSQTARLGESRTSSLSGLNAMGHFFSAASNRNGMTVFVLMYSVMSSLV